MVEIHRKGTRCQNMRCIASKLMKWRPFENQYLKCDLHKKRYQQDGVAFMSQPYLVEVVVEVELRLRLRLWLI